MSRSMHAGKSHRLLRVGELLRHALSDIFNRGDLHDPAFHGVSVTVTEVRVSPDLHNATVFVMPLGGQYRDDVMAALARCSGYIRGQLSREVTLRYMPRLVFELDRTFDEAEHIESLLKTPRVAKDLENTGLNEVDDDIPGNQSWGNGSAGKEQG